MIKFIMLVLCLVSASCFADQDEIATAQFAGDIGQFALPLTALAFTFGEKNSTYTNQFYKSIGTTLGIAYSLKYAVNEKRPNGTDYSFPSGHTSAAFAGASFIQTTYGWQFGAPAYAAAAYVGWTRVETKGHWTHDVIAGAALGIGVNYFFLNQKRKSPAIFLIQPGIDEKGDVSVNASYHW